MAGELRWWVIPGALVVLLGVLSLGDTPREPAPNGAGANELAARVDGGPRQPLTLAGQIERALLLKFGDRFKDQRIDMRIWRRLDGHREAQPWLTLRPRVRADGTIPMAGLTAGRYDIEVKAANGDKLVADDVAVPGTFRFASDGGR